MYSAYKSKKSLDVPPYVGSDRRFVVSSAAAENGRHTHSACRVHSQFAWSATFGINIKYKKLSHRRETAQQPV